MPQPVKVGLVTNATGAHVGAYLNALRDTKACASVAIADPDNRWVDSARKVLGPKLTAVYRDAKAMLAKEQPTLAMVTMEAKIAPTAIDGALEAGCHVFAEKPACLSAKEFAPLINKADSKHLHVMFALANRLNPEFITARQLIADGVIGKVYGVDAHLVADQTRLTNAGFRAQWYAQKKRAGGGHLVWLGIHWLDLIQNLTGSDITEVNGFIANVGGQPIDIEDSATATLRFDNGTLGTFTSGYYLKRGYHSGIKVWGSEGWLHLQQMLDQPLHWLSNKGENAGKVQTWKGNKQPRGYTPFVRACVEAIANDTEPPISNADSLRAVKVVYAIYDAAEQRKTIRLP
ncbi:MAG: oxidoreductase [Verrucomicrobiales bacterium]|nr:oxidoreductase [Verrucomicrobiales bacterium]|tara:strand:- start:6177 stop:7214 length:1038 start_codon:yes stop_codon:yes gene_type:complete